VILENQICRRWFRRSSGILGLLDPFCFHFGFLVFGSIYLCTKLGVITAECWVDTEFELGHVGLGLGHGFAALGDGRGRGTCIVLDDVDALSHGIGDVLKRGDHLGCQ